VDNRKAALTLPQAMYELRKDRSIDLYMCADRTSWALTYGRGWVTPETVDEMLRTGKLARRWAEMPCYYWYSNRSVEKPVPAKHEKLIAAVRDRTLALAKAEYREFERRKAVERKEREEAKRARAAERRRAKHA
jgi:hypothetical protein